MAEDTRSYMERTNSLSEKSMGRKPTIEDYERRFKTMDPGERISVLDAMDQDAADDTPLSVSRALKIFNEREARNRLTDLHHAMQKAGR